MVLELTSASQISHRNALSPSRTGCNDMAGMTVLIVGGGGREHALAIGLAESESVGAVHTCPGNAGTSLVGTNHPVSATDDEAINAFKYCSKLEGIIPALEPAHALAHLIKVAPNMKKDEIGSRLKHSSQRQGIEPYLNDMEACFSHFNRILKKDGYFVFIIGDCIINHQRYSGKDLTAKMIEKTGFKMVNELNYELDEISKLFVKAFRQKKKKEHIILLRNVAQSKV